MEKYKQLITRARDLADEEDEELLNVLWQVIFYSPKTVMLPFQRQQLDEAAKFSLKIRDSYHHHSEILINGFKWGNGPHKILLTHGWASKAAEFSEIIIALGQLPEVSVIAFDAPGNGSSEGRLSNLAIYIDAVKAVMKMQGQPQTLIGHSMGATANAAAMQEIDNLSPAQLISLAPLIRLKEIFIAHMGMAHVSVPIKNLLFKRIETLLNMPLNALDMDQNYRMDNQVGHWIAYDKEDEVSSHEYLNNFLEKHSDIVSQAYHHVGHKRMISDPNVIADILKRVRTQISQNQRDKT